MGQQIARTVEQVDACDGAGGRLLAVKGKAIAGKHYTRPGVIQHRGGGGGAAGHLQRGRVIKAGRKSVVAQSVEKRDLCHDDTLADRTETYARDHGLSSVQHASEVTKNSGDGAGLCVELPQ